MRKGLTTLLLTAAVLLGIPAAAHASGPVCSTVQQTAGNSYGLLNNLQIAAPLSAGLDLTGNALGLLGSATATSSSSDTNTCG